MADTRWKPGQSGNPHGRPRRGNTFTEALRAKGTPEELAELVWQKARSGEPWALQLIYSRCEPQATRLSISTEANPDGYDLSRLSDTELDQFIQLAMRARSASIAAITDGGEGAPALP